MGSLYRYYNEHGELLYVGRTRAGIARGFAHESSSRWWPLVASAEFHSLPDDMLPLAEKLAIWVDRPLYNRALRMPTWRRQAMLADLARDFDRDRYITLTDAARVVGLTRRELRLAVVWGFLKTDFPRAMHLTYEQLEEFIGVEDGPVIAGSPKAGDDRGSLTRRVTAPHLAPVKGDEE